MACESVLGYLIEYKSEDHEQKFLRYLAQNYEDDFDFWIGLRERVATKILEDFGGSLCKVFIVGWEPVSTIHYTRPGTCINHPLH